MPRCSSAMVSIAWSVGMLAWMIPWRRPFEGWLRGPSIRIDHPVDRSVADGVDAHVHPGVVEQSDLLAVSPPAPLPDSRDSLRRPGVVLVPRPRGATRSARRRCRRSTALCPRRSGGRPPVAGMSCNGPDARDEGLAHLDSVRPALQRAKPRTPRPPSASDLW